MRVWEGKAYVCILNVCVCGREREAEKVMHTVYVCALLCEKCKKENVCCMCVRDFTRNVELMCLCVCVQYIMCSMCEKIKVERLCYICRSCHLSGFVIIGATEVPPHMYNTGMPGPFRVQRFFRSY